MPVVSVVIPAYNASRYVAQTLQSVCDQTLDDIEVIVVDDGSTDETAAIVAGFCERDARVRLLSQPNSHAGVARNRGMAEASGEYLYFLDADDLVERTALATMVEGARSCDADVVVCRSRKLDVRTGATEGIYYALRDWPLRTPLTQEQVAQTLFRSVVGWPWDKLFRREFVAAHGLEFQSLRSTNDAYFVFVAMALARTTYCVPEVLVTHRVNDSSSVSNTRGASWDNSLIAARAIGQRLRDEGIYGLFERTYLNWCVDFTKWNVDTLDDASAARLVGEARELLTGVPLDEGFYFLKEDCEFARLFAQSADELVLTAARQAKELRNARRLYSSWPYRLAMRLARPLRFVAYRVLRRT